MKLTKNQIYIGVGLAVLAFWYFRKNKNGKIDNPNQIDTYGTSIDIRQSKEMNWVGVDEGSRKQATAGIQIGTNGMINGTEPCTVSELWHDDKDRVGSFKCEGRDVYDLAGGSRFEF